MGGGIYQGWGSRLGRLRVAAGGVGDPVRLCFEMVVKLFSLLVEISISSSGFSFFGFRS